jgi:hypothetical protein
VHLDEPLETFHGAHDSGNSAVRAIANAGILRMTGQLEFACLCDRYDSPKELIDAFPHRIGVCCPTLELSKGLIKFVIPERRESRVPATVLWFGSQVAENCDVVAQCTDARRTRLFDQFAQLIDLAVPCITWSKEHVLDIVLEGAPRAEWHE